MARSLTPAAVLALVGGIASGCSFPVGPPATLSVHAGGIPSGAQGAFGGFGGFQPDVTILRNGTVVRSWDPFTHPSITVAPGVYVLMIGGRAISDLITCTGDGSDPTCTRETGGPIVVCRMPIALGPGDARTLSIDLGAIGPDCQEPSG